jgi:hypothetical protein
MIKWALFGCTLLGFAASDLSAGPLDFLKSRFGRKPSAAPNVITTNGKSKSKVSIPVTLTSGPCYGEPAATWGNAYSYDPYCDDCPTDWCETARVKSLQKCRKCFDQSYYPICSPYCAPGWGYYPTCWRRMPECWQCPKESMEFMPASAPAAELPPQAPPVPESNFGSSLPE